MNIKRPFAPTFLNKLDNFLLLNKPSTWAARAHLVFYYSLLFIAALAAVYFFVPDDARSATSIHVWVGFLSVICIIATVGWLIYLLRFNVFKRFGNIKPTTSLVDFLLYFLAISVIISFCLVPIAIETAKANRNYGSNELVNDINNINLNINRLEYDSLPKTWRRDTLVVVDTLPNQRFVAPPTEYYDDDVTTVTTDTAYAPAIRRYRLVDTLNLVQMMHNKDSLQQLNDSTYVLLNCPEYIFLRVFNFRGPSAAQLLTSKQIYERVYKNYVAPDKTKTRAELRGLVDKYYYADNDKYYYYHDGNQSYGNRIEKLYKLRNLEDSMEHIAERKYRWSQFGDIFFKLWFYTSFSLTLLLFAFRHTTVRVFFLSILSMVIIFIITMLFMAFFKSRGVASYMWLIFYFTLFLIISATTFSDRRRKAVKGIAINLFMFILPFLPLIATGMYYAWKAERYHSIITSNLLLNYEARSLHFLIAQIAGPLLFLLILVVYLHRLYRKWYGLPVE